MSDPLSFIAVYDAVCLLIALVGLGCVLRYRRLSHWCYLLTLCGFLSCSRLIADLIQSWTNDSTWHFRWLVALLQLSPDLDWHFSRLFFIIVSALQTLGLCGLLVSLNRKIDFLREASRAITSQPPHPSSPD